MPVLITCKNCGTSVAMAADSASKTCKCGSIVMNHGHIKTMFYMVWNTDWSKINTKKTTPTLSELLNPKMIVAALSKIRKK